MHEHDEPGESSDLDDAPEEVSPSGTGEELAANAQVHKNAWAQTIEDMEAVAEELRENGYETVISIPAGDTAPEPPGEGIEGRFGLTYVVPGNYEEEFVAAVEAGDFPSYEVFRAEAEGRIFIVTQLLDPETSTAILIAGNFERRHAGGLVRAVVEEDVMFTHVQKLDGTQLGSFRHEDYEPFFPDADRILADFEAQAGGDIYDDGDEA